MKKNIGTFDSVVRLFTTVVLTVLYLLNVFSFVGMFVALFIGVWLLATSVSGVCPLYKLFGINTGLSRRTS